MIKRSFFITKKRKRQQRFYFPLVAKSEQSVIDYHYINHLRPYFVDRPHHYNFLLQGFPLLRKEIRAYAAQIRAKFKEKFTTYSPFSLNQPSLQIHYSAPIGYQNNRKSFLLAFTASIFLWTIILLSILVYPYFHHSHHNPYGNSNQGKPVDVVFLPQSTGNSGLTGEGYNGEPPQQTIQTPPPPASLPAIPSEPSSLPTPEPTITQEEENNITPLPRAEPIPEKQPKPIQKKHQKTKLQDRQYTYHYNTPSHPRPRPSQPRKTNSPFDNVTNLNFNENPQSSHRKTNRIPAQGSRSAINMSTGPLVKNGKINVPYANKVSIKGVTADYGNELSAWIYRHLYYPLDAAKRGEDGTPSVHIAINRDGHVVSVDLTKSSGSEALDAAITGMFRNAQLPKTPPDLPDPFTVDIEVNYILIRR